MPRHNDTVRGRGQRKQKSRTPAPHRTRPPLPVRTETLTIAAIGTKGDGIANADDRTVHIPYTAPGDQIIAKTVGEGGRLETMIAPGPDRADPVCGLFGSCGGCALQHLTTGFQADWKADQITQALIRENGITYPVRQTITLPTNIRQRATLAMKRNRKEKLEIGFRERRTHHIVPMTECHIVHPESIACDSNAAEPA